MATTVPVKFTVMVDVDPELYELAYGLGIASPAALVDDAKDLFIGRVKELLIGQGDGYIKDVRFSIF